MSSYARAYSSYARANVHIKKMMENSHQNITWSEMEDVQAKSSTVKVFLQLHQSVAMQYIDIGEFLGLGHERANRIYFPFH